MSELKKIALRAVVSSLNPQEPGQLLVGSSKRNSGSIFGVSVWRGSVVAWQSSSSKIKIEELYYYASVRGSAGLPHLCLPRLFDLAL